MNNSREEKKWAPFESLFQVKNVLKELETKREKHSKPVLSEDEMYILETSILEAFHTHAKVKVSYYFQGFTYYKIGIIVQIRKPFIYFQDHSSLYFEQILHIHFL